jgi:hypothetical protein
VSHRCTGAGGADYGHPTVESQAYRHTDAFGHTHGYSLGDADPVADTDAGARHTFSHAPCSRQANWHAAADPDGGDDGAAGSPNDAHA